MCSQAPPARLPQVLSRLAPHSAQSSARGWGSWPPGGTPVQVPVRQQEERHRRRNHNGEDQKDHCCVGITRFINIIQADEGKHRVSYNDGKGSQNKQHGKQQPRYHQAVCLIHQSTACHSQQADRIAQKRHTAGNGKPQQHLPAILYPPVHHILVLIGNAAHNPHIDYRNPCQPGLPNSTPLGNGIKAQRLQHIAGHAKNHSNAHAHQHGAGKRDFVARPQSKAPIEFHITSTFL